jgi:uncharacterized protein YndB with AHSA1/START domain
VIDVSHHINAVRRAVGARTLEAGEARVVTVARAYDAPIEEVWNACTDPERIPRWFLPVTGELKPGGHYQLEGNAGGTVRTCDPPHGFTATWEFGEQVSWIELRLTPRADGGTDFALDHIVPVDDHWTEFGPGAVGIGWELGLLGLALHLRTGADVDPAARAFPGSPEGQDFIRRSSTAWEQADISGGTDPATARAAAHRTTTAYTG